MQPLYLEQTQGIEQYHRYMASQRGGIANGQAVAPRGSQTAKQIYVGDIYSKGAWILHTLRHMIGDDPMATLLRRMAYPDPAMEGVSNGDQTRFVTTEDFVSLAEEISGRELDWFFEVYVRQPELPKLFHSVRDGKLFLQWETPGDLDFSLPVDVRIGDNVERVDMTNGEAVIDVNVPADQIEIDPDHWILMEGG
jgi:aminopeptidase N